MKLLLFVNFICRHVSNKSGMRGRCCSNQEVQSTGIRGWWTPSSLKLNFFCLMSWNTGRQLAGVCFYMFFHVFSCFKQFLSLLYPLALAVALASHHFFCIRLVGLHWKILKREAVSQGKVHSLVRCHMSWWETRWMLTLSHSDSSWVKGFEPKDRNGLQETSLESAVATCVSKSIKIPC